VPSAAEPREGRWGRHYGDDVEPVPQEHHIRVNVKQEAQPEHVDQPSTDARGYELKAFEDALDAVVCARVGACVLDGKAKLYGDRKSAIWVPVRK